MAVSEFESLDTRKSDFKEPDTEAVDIGRIFALLADRCWYSSENLAVALSISQAGANCGLDKLRHLGLAIEFDPELGHRLSPEVRLLDGNRIAARMPATLRDALQYVETSLVTDSTNSAAMRWLRHGGFGHALFLTEMQSSGRGRRGRTWVSPIGRNITLSVVWPVPDLDAALEGFSLVVALSLVDALQSLSVRGAEKLRVKWPNDVWLGDGKLAGILLELHNTHSGPRHVVIGIGLNVHMPESVAADSEYAFSDLYSFGNSTLDRNELVAAVLTKLVSNLETLSQTGFEGFRDRWQTLDMLQGREVNVLGHGQPLNGYVKGVSVTGALRLQTGDGEKQITGGEVAPTVRLANMPVGFGE